MPFTKVIEPKIRAYVKVMKEENQYPASYIARKVDISERSVFRISKEDFRQQKKKPSIKRGGRPRKLDARDGRMLVRQIKKLRREEGNFSAKRLMTAAGLSPENVSVRTVQRDLRSKGYKFLVARRKGILTEKDLQRRVDYCKGIKKHWDLGSLWTEKIAFYLDGVSFYHKFNPADQARAPKGRIWRTQKEGLAVGCTAKGEHAGSGGRVLHLLVAITFHGGVILCYPYDKMCGETFATFIRNKFEELFQISGKNSCMFLQDGDPSQNSKAAKRELENVKSTIFPIPPRSPELNPIENLFHVVKRKLSKEALEKTIKHESFEEFTARVICTMYSMDKSYIDNLITSMSKRVDLIIEQKGQRTKY